MIRFKLPIVGVLLATLALMVAAPAFAFGTKDKTYRIHRACLIKEAQADVVIRRPDGGGVATWNHRGVHGSTFWTYKTWLGLVDSVTYYWAGIPGLPKHTKQSVKRCLLRGI